jgi:hypothetical protein
MRLKWIVSWLLGGSMIVAGCGSADSVDDATLGRAEVATVPLGAYFAPDPGNSLFLQLLLQDGNRFHLEESLCDSGTPDCGANLGPDPNGIFDGKYSTADAGGGFVDLSFTDDKKGKIGTFVVLFDAKAKTLRVFTRAEESFVMKLAVARPTLGTYRALMPQDALFRVLVLKPGNQFHREDSLCNSGTANCEANAGPDPNGVFDGTYELKLDLIGFVIDFTDAKKGKIGAFLGEAGGDLLTIFTSPGEGFIMHRESQ